MKNLSQTDSISVAFHFQYIQRGEEPPASPVCLKLLGRVISKVLPKLTQIGSIQIRMGQLLYTQDLDSELEADWRKSMPEDISHKYLDVNSNGKNALVPLDRIYVVTISGKLLGQIAAIEKQFRRYRKYRYLFGVIVSPNSYCHDVIYRVTPTIIGVLQSNGILECASSSIEFEPHLDQMLTSMKIESAFSETAMNDFLRLIN